MHDFIRYCFFPFVLQNNGFSCATYNAMKTSNNSKRRKKRWEMLQKMRKVIRTRVYVK